MPKSSKSNLTNSTFLFQSFKNLSLFLSFSIFTFLLIFNFSVSSFANFEPEGPKPPTFPTPSGLQENDNSIVQSSSSILSSSSSISKSSQISIFQSSLFSNSTVSSSFSSSLAQSNQVLTNISTSSLSNSSSSKIVIPEIAQDGTVRTGGFSSFLFIFVIIGGIFGFRYWQIKNRTLKMAEKKIK